MLSDNTSSFTATAGLYTDFGGLAQLRAKASQTAEANGLDNNNSHQATKEVAKQFEALFVQAMLKTMREASQLSESTDSDQTRFYLEMFDKQIALDLTNRGNGIGIAKQLERELSPQSQFDEAAQLQLVQQQIARAQPTHKQGDGD